MKESLDFIYKEQKELGKFGGIASLLGWDQMTYMPSAGGEERSDQLSLISRLAHERVISDDFYHHITRLNEQHTYETLGKKDQMVVKRLLDDVEKSRKIPSSFVEKMSKTTTLAYMAWQEAKTQNKYKHFAPHLEKVIGLQREYCDYMRLPGHPYNSLLDDYEEGMTVAKLQTEFSFLKPKLVELLQKITASKRYEKQQELSIKADKIKQQEISMFLFQKLGLTHDKTRLDESAHPFTTTIGDDDVRITTNYNHDNPLFSFFSTVHEAGHALYELGLPQNELKDTVLSDTPSLGLHESQSRFWENMIGRSEPFWSYFYPVFKKTYPDELRLMDPITWYRFINQVKPSLIRVEADELTYCLHVILRFELELLLIEGKVTVTELPSVWNQKMNEYLSVVPQTDQEGVLQDMHWSGGDFGYFPTYAIGTIYAAQLYYQLTKEHPKITNEIGWGEFSTTLQWLRTHIHCHGRTLTADEIIKNTCGEGLNANVFVTYLKDKYYQLYDLS
ncbi:MAG: carboxypeptidase M32 [Euryarchaeota archaeon]|nr:carboxypeptidase M32 [Euryarchaeota archaeon]